MSKNIPLSLYIHIPWCEKKCPYCDFNSHTLKSKLDENAYIDALLLDFHHDIVRFKSEIQDRSIDSIFIGGGTPSLFKPEHFARLLTQLREGIEFADNIEITLEANPGSSETSKFIGFRQAGINRLSIGIQSFNAQHLRALGRVHNQDEALAAAQAANRAGFEHINLDLMFGLPEQTTEQCLSDIKQAISQKTTHLSCYQLTIEPNTLFHHQPPVTPDHEALWDMQCALQTYLLEAGFKQYEVSAYAKNEHQCRHNLNYWQFGDYLAIGAGAHGKLTDKHSQIKRFWKSKHPTHYLNYAQNDLPKLTGGLNTIAEQDKPFEFMLNALRLTSGFNLSLFEQRTGLEKHTISDTLQSHQEQELVELNDGHIAPTNKGRLFIDTMLQSYLQR